MKILDFKLIALILFKESILIILVFGWAMNKLQLIYGEAKKIFNWYLKYLNKVVNYQCPMQTLFVLALLPSWTFFSMLVILNSTTSGKINSSSPIELLKNPSSMSRTITWIQKGIYIFHLYLSISKFRNLNVMDY